MELNPQSDVLLIPRRREGLDPLSSTRFPMFVRRLHCRSLCCLIWPWFVVAGSADESLDAPPAYYDDAKGLVGSALKQALHTIIDDHTVVSYSWPPFLDIDESASRSGDVDLIYSGLSRDKSLNGGATGDWNREHLWPRAYGISNDGGADDSDLFNLRPCDVQVNAERGSLPFDFTDEGSAIELQFSAPGCSKDSDSWEPRDDEKGDIARACFYMDVRYDGSDQRTEDLELSDVPDRATAEFGHRLTLLRWHRLDPPDKRERERNHAVYSRWQGNRNPFVARPEFAELIYLANYPALDDDADGLPDWWEVCHHGGLEANGLDDIYGDGAPALLEFVANSNPLDSKQSPPAISISRDRTGFSYRWSEQADAAGISARIEFSPDLSPGSWRPANVAGYDRTPLGGGAIQIEAWLPPFPEGQRSFFRLSVLAPSS